MTRPRSWRARLPGWLALLVVAAAINVVVAWACALWSTRQVWPTETSYTLVLPPDTSPAFDALRIRWVPKAWLVEERAPLSWDGRHVSIGTETGFGVRILRLVMREMNPIVTYGISGVGAVLVLESGWPMPSLEAAHIRVPPIVLPGAVPRTKSSFSTIPDGAHLWHGAFQAPTFMGGRPVTPNFGTGWFPVPYLIRPLGFTCNTLFYFTVITLPAFTFRRTRTHLRRRRGLCTRCAYTLNDLALCPECGTPRDRLMAAPLKPVHSTPP